MYSPLTPLKSDFNHFEGNLEPFFTDNRTKMLIQPLCSKQTEISCKKSQFPDKRDEWMRFYQPGLTVLGLAVGFAPRALWFVAAARAGAAAPLWVPVLPR